MPRFSFPSLRFSGLCLALLSGTVAGAGSLVPGGPAQVNPAQVNTSQTYTVRAGDTAYSVARLAGTDVATLLALNALSTPDLRPGQVLRLPGGSGSAAPRIHTVAEGQTLYSVARMYGLKAGEVQDFNRLSSPDLRPGQVLTLPPEAPPIQAGPPAPAPAQSPPLPRYTVLAGQTLYSIARLYRLRATDLLTLNSLQATDLHPGQVLLLPAGAVALAAPALPPVVPPASAAPSGALLSPGVPLPAPPGPDTPRSDLPQPSSLPNDVTVPDGGWRGLAMSLLGVPYLYGGQSRSGTDCSGLVLQVFGPLGLKLPRQSAMQAQTGSLVHRDDLQAGDLLFFDTEGRGTVTHVGIYLGEGAFINANSYGGQVAINQLSERYFAQRYLWARRVLGVLAQGR
ncbi:LysM peptidoglycan-binding domain-containing protein [Deinococcus sp.]|uniref:C40 family peptidase n=1 Tax=Deinococcus sp. TaxID=47478 RepID=UPI003C7E8501